mmetsp:Transcript_15603/g.35831  ORF Transcript_15603/g.35831 Transcript_15603/m.35831 type:complete len:231 (+) Transcript_15603:1375-2067(+)
MGLWWCRRNAAAANAAVDTSACFVEANRSQLIIMWTAWAKLAIFSLLCVASDSASRFASSSQSCGVWLQACNRYRSSSRVTAAPASSAPSIALRTGKTSTSWISRMGIPTSARAVASIIESRRVNSHTRFRAPSTTALKIGPYSTDWGRSFAKEHTIAATSRPCTLSSLSAAAAGFCKPLLLELEDPPLPSKRSLNSTASCPAISSTAARRRPKCRAHTTNSFHLNHGNA